MKGYNKFMIIYYNFMVNIKLVYNISNFKLHLNDSTMSYLMSTLINKEIQIIFLKYKNLDNFKDILSIKQP